jgi:N-acyl-D-amino-acid deacylase
LKTAGKNNWHKLDSVLEMIDHYRKKGIDVRFDRYPYTESQTMLSVILPPPYDKMSDRDITIALKDGKLRSYLRDHLAENCKNDWQKWRLTGTSAPEWKCFIGKKYSDLPTDAADAVIGQLAFDATTATIGAAGMSEENMKKIILSPLCMPGSDGNALPQDDRFGRAHPRAFGAIAEFIRLKLENGCPPGETVKAATSSPAAFFNLPEIGTIAPEKKADITVFSPDDIGSNADFIEPHIPANGIIMTAVNGEFEIY